METLIAILFVVAMFLGWAVGGEPGFGKGKRGLLLSVPMILFFLTSIPWSYLMLTPLFLYIIYQLLFYDMGISLVYDDNKWYGWLIIGLNGAIIGLTPIMLAAATANYIGIASSIVAGILGFCGVVFLANSPKTKGFRDFLNKYMPSYPYLRFKDAWYVCEGLMGAILGIVIKLFW
jgi:hypothetical protein